MKLLVLGGTGFVGRQIVEAAVARGHTVTLFNRGQSDPGAFRDLERLHGDRARDLSALEGRRWDAAVDTSGYVPRVVGTSARLLAASVGHYTFVSSLYVYADQTQCDVEESAPLAQRDDPSDETVTPETAGALKATCEQAVEEAMPGRGLITRCGLLVGPNDLNGRFTYWARRVVRGGEVLVPGPPDRVVQVIDARDLAAWIVEASERVTHGVFNVAGPEKRLPMSAFVETIQATTGSDAHVTWLDSDFLRAESLSASERLALFPWERGTALSRVTAGDPFAMPTLAVRKAVQAGLRFRPLAETVRDTLAWDAHRPDGNSYRAELGPERERGLLAAWHARGAAVV